MRHERHTRRGPTHQYSGGMAETSSSRQGRMVDAPGARLRASRASPGDCARQSLPPPRAAEAVAVCLSGASWVVEKRSKGRDQCGRPGPSLRWTTAEVTRKSGAC